MLRRLVERRSGLRWWAPLVWALGYASFILTTLWGFSARDWSGLLRAFLLFLLVALVVVQWVRPTVLGWGLLSAPAASFALAGVVTMVASILVPAPYGQPPSGVTAVGAVLQLSFVLVVGAVVYTGWPRRLEAAAASQQARPADSGKL
jgi:hypothetical protein